MRPYFLAALLLASTITVLTPTATAHCGVPTSVECVVDWVDAAGDGRWCGVVKTIARVWDIKCPTLWSN